MASRSNPFDTIERMFDRMSDQFQDAARSWETGEQFLYSGAPEEPLATDVYSDDEAYVVTIDVPGFAREDIEVRVTENVLYVEAEHGESTEVDDDRYVRRERSHRSMGRSITLPGSVEQDGVTATLKHGVLTVTIPKAEPLEEGTPIEIEGE